MKQFILPTAAALLTAAATLFLAVPSMRLRLWPAAPPSELADLVAAVGTERAIEPRLTGGFAYAPVHAPVRAGETTVDVRSPDVRIAAAKIEKQAAQRRSPMALESLGIAYLVMGDVDKAVPVLEEAADQSKPVPSVLSDVAAAYLVRATRHQQSQDFAKALAFADRAVKADSQLTEAWFNRALALERLSLMEQAREAWRDYLRVDSTSGWAADARSHLNALTASPQPSRQ